MRTFLQLWLIVLLAVPLAAQEESQTPPEGEETAEAQEAAAADEEAAAAGEEAEAAPEVDRVTFNVALSDERGGGQVQGSAGAFEYQEGRYLIATGGVELKYQALTVTAERARIDIPANLLTAEGNVVLDEGPRRLTGESIEFDLNTQTGRVVEATAYVDPGYYFSGREITKLSEDTYHVDHGTFTSCDQDVPSWSFRLAEARITIDGYARIKHARMRLKKLPVLYFPYVLWPAKTDRTTGLLMPNPGLSGRRGASLGLGYYQTMGRSADATFMVDVSARKYYGFGTEFRYRPSERTHGEFTGYFLQEPETIDGRYVHNVFGTHPSLGYFDQSGIQYFPDDEGVFYDSDGNPLPDGTVIDQLYQGEDRWKINFFHETTDIWNHFRAVVAYEDYSDYDYRHDFERHVGRQTQNFIYSKAYFSGNVGRHSLNIMLAQRERLRTNSRTDIRRQLPEIEYRLRSTRLGPMPLYLSLDANVHLFELEQYTTFTQEPSVYTDRYGRLDVAPTLSLPLSTLTWLSAKLDVGGRWTRYDKTLGSKDDATGSPYTGDAHNRTFSRIGFEAIGPSFSRIFDSEGGRFSKFKHVIQPRWTYGNISDFEEDLDEDQNQGIPRFDEIDIFRPYNALTYGVVNRLLAKPTDEEKGGGFEIASFELSQSYSFDAEDFPGQKSPSGEKSARSPLRALLRFNPSATTSLKVETRYNTLDSYLQSLSLSGNTKLGRHTFGLTWYTRWKAALAEADEAEEVTEPVPEPVPLPVIDEISSNQARFFTTLVLLPERLSFDASVSYDFEAPDERSKIRQQRYFINWKSKCYSLQFEIRQSGLFRNEAAGEVNDLDYRFMFTLKNVGTFLDLGGRAQSF
ncbi:MAG: LPS-assembly protein LptD [bacterium]|nr:LPS-assembly protein LptD [bacterium]